MLPVGYQFRVKCDNHTKASSLSDYSRGKFFFPGSAGLVNFGLIFRKSVELYSVRCCSEVASYPGLLAPAFVACSTNAGEGLVKLSHVV